MQQWLSMNNKQLLALKGNQRSGVLDVNNRKQWLQPLHTTSYFLLTFILPGIFPARIYFSREFWPRQQHKSFHTKEQETKQPEVETNSIKHFTHKKFFLILLFIVYHTKNYAHFFCIYSYVFIWGFGFGNKTRWLRQHW